MVPVNNTVLGKSLELCLFLKVLLKKDVAVGQRPQSGGCGQAVAREERKREHRLKGTKALLPKISAEVQTHPPQFFFN